METKLTYLDENDRPSFPYILDFKDWVKENYTSVDVDDLNEYRRKYDEYLDSFDEDRKIFENPINLFMCLDGADRYPHKSEYDEIIAIGSCKNLRFNNNLDDRCYLFVKRME
jgi:hypothetical protein